MIGSKWYLAPAVILLALSMTGISGSGYAAPDGPALSVMAQQGGSPGLLHRVDTFPTCVEQRRCSTSNSGQRRCGWMTRCQECQYARQCDRAGCTWRQVCKWGPYKPVLKTN